MGHGETNHISRKHYLCEGLGYPVWIRWVGLDGSAITLGRPMGKPEIMGQKIFTVSQRSMSLYTKAKLGYGGKPYASMYELVCQALAMDGMPRPQGKSFKDWANEKCYYIDEYLFSNGIRKKKPKNKAARIVVRKAEKERSDKDDFVKSNAFLSSYEWRRVRMEALKMYGGRCQCCGASPATGAVLNVDHIKPRKKYPHLALNVDNLQVLCGACNHGKGNWDETDWRKNS